MSKSSELLEQLLKHSEIDTDTLVEAALSLHVNGRKNSGIHKFAHELRLMDDLTSQINHVFRNLIIRTISENQKTLPNAPSFNSQINSTHESDSEIERKYNSLQQSYQDLLSEVSKNNNLVSELTQIVKQNSSLMEQHTNAIAKLEEGVQKSLTKRSYTKKDKDVPQNSIANKNKVALVSSTPNIDRQDHAETSESISSSETSVNNDTEPVP
ncbi:hypothetical protein PV403_02800 [Paenibacillus sp. GYB006]|uniref:hypothetical protein n=1 Tax=Paenibacillus sp. GYB006 TaxID=2994394 RepID=UPI002F96B586